LQKNSPKPLRKAIYIFFLLISTNLFAATTGPNNDYYVVHDFHDDWQVYDNRLKLYVPYITEQHLEIPSHTIFCNVEDNRGYQLLIRSKKTNFLFINGSLRQKIEADKWLVMNIDSLYRVYQKPTIYITLYGTTDIESKAVLIGYRKTSEQKAIVQSEETLITAKPRPISPHRNYFVIVSMMILIMFTYLSSSYSRAFQRYYNLRDLFTFYLREQSFLINKPLSRMNILFVVLLSLLISLFYMFLQSRGIYMFGGRSVLQEGDTMGVLFSNYFRLSLFTFVGLIGKYFLIGMVAGLFNLEKVVDIHYFKIIQSSILFYTGLVLVLCVVFTGYVSPDTNWQVYLFAPIVAFYAIRFVILYFTINRTVTIPNLYLISYLCIVELLPIILGIRFAV
jgi:Domain of unknown function (DUF4271)